MSQSPPAGEREGMGGGGVEKHGRLWGCGEVGTFQNIVACHRKDD